jgi:hypothetical protein
MWTLGLDENKLKIVVYPNPTSDYIHVTSEFQPEKLTLVNMMGAQVRTATNTDNLAVSDLPPGNYQLFVQNGNKTANSSITIY